MSAVRLPGSGISKSEKEILRALAKLGGERIADDGVRREGNEFIIPRSMTLREAVKFLSEYIAAEEQVHSFSRTFNYRPWDGAHATQLALRELTGTSGIGQVIRTFFGDQMPEMRTINVGPGQTEQVPWGHIAVPLFKGTVQLGATKHPEYGMLFSLGVEAPRRYRAQIEGLFTLIQSKLEEKSIYKGKAIDGQEEAEFLDLTGVDPDKVIYNDEVRTQLEANIWSLIRHTDLMREKDIPLKRAAMIAGPYGTGKTLAGYLTAQLAVQNGWTSVYCRPEKDDLFEVIQTARLYQPAVVFFEDVDTVAEGDESGISRLLDVFDGITAKGTELIAVMTTNHPERIHKGMIRPGRLDSIIHIGALDEGGVTEMIEKYVPEGHRAPELDYETIAHAMDGFLPAFIRESLDRTMRYAIARNNGEPGLLETDDFVFAAAGLRPQLELMSEAGEGKKKPTIDAALEELVQRKAGEAVEGKELYSYQYEEETHKVVANGD